MGLGYMAYRSAGRTYREFASIKPLSEVITPEMAEAAGAATGEVAHKAAHGAAYNLGVLIGKRQAKKAAKAEAKAAKAA